MPCVAFCSDSDSKKSILRLGAERVQETFLEFGIRKRVGFYGPTKLCGPTDFVFPLQGMFSSARDVLLNVPADSRPD